MSFLLSPFSSLLELVFIFGVHVLCSTFPFTVLFYSVHTVPLHSVLIIPFLELLPYTFNSMIHACTYISILCLMKTT